MNSLFEVNTSNIIKRELEGIKETEVNSVQEQPQVTTEQLPANLIKYRELLEENNFLIRNNKVCKRADTGSKVIANFIPVPVKKIFYTNGGDTDIRYRLKAIMIKDGMELEEIEISKEQYTSFKFIIGSEWEQQAFVENNRYINVRELAQVISQKSMSKTELYGNTGFERINGNLIYLYHEGSIGVNNENIKAKLTEGNLYRYSFTNKVFDPKEAIRTSYSILELGDKKVTIPLLSYTYIAPLISLLGEENIFINFMLIFNGKTGTFKSSTAALSNSHFGNFNRNNFAASLDDSDNNIEKKAYILKDTVLVPDDFNSKVNIKVVKKLLGAFGDRNGKGRMNSDCSLRTTYYARGGAIMTAEFIPNLGESRLARAIILDFKKGTINQDKLTVLQNNNEKLAYAMKTYILWVIKNEAWIKNTAKQIVNVIKIDNPNVHKRTVEAINMLYLGFYIVLTFFKSCEVIDEQEVNSLMNEAVEILKELANKQTDEIEESNPINMFYNAIEEMVNTNTIYMLDYKNGQPVKHSSKGQFVGYKDEEYYYFYQDTIYAEVDKYYRRNGNKFPINRASLLKMLDQEGLLHKTDVSRKTVMRTAPDTGEKIRVIAVKIPKREEVVVEQPETL